MILQRVGLVPTYIGRHIPETQPNSAQGLPTKLDHHCHRHHHHYNHLISTPDLRKGIQEKKHHFFWAKNDFDFFFLKWKSYPNSMSLEGDPLVVSYLKYVCKMTELALRCFCVWDSNVLWSSVYLPKLELCCVCTRIWNVLQHTICFNTKSWYLYLYFRSTLKHSKVVLCCIEGTSWQARSLGTAVTTAFHVQPLRPPGKQ